MSEITTAEQERHRTKTMPQREQQPQPLLSQVENLRESLVQLNSRVSHQFEPISLSYPTGEPEKQAAVPNLSAIESSLAQSQEIVSEINEFLDNLAL